MDLPLSDVDIRSHLKDVPGFVGVYSYDCLPGLENGEFCVVNTDNIIPLFDDVEGGHHWLTVCCEQDDVLVFDSFGRTLRQMELDYTEPQFEWYFRRAYPNCTLYTNTQILQNTSTAVCGWYTILVWKLFSRHGIDETLNELQRVFTQDTLNNDRMMVGGSFEQLANELHKQRRVHFPRRPVVVHDIDDIWSADLVDMQAFSKYNKGYKFMLTVIDLYSRYAWAIPLKDKTGATVRNAFQHIVRTSGRIPKKLWVDEGKEFYNNIMKKWLKDMDIKMYSTHNEGKAVVIERFNRTLKTWMWRHFSASSAYVYINILPNLLSRYNNTKHRGIGITPAEASMDVQPVFKKEVPHPTPRFQLGDEVRIAVSKRHFEKGYTPNWTEEVFVIHQVLPTHPVTYRIRDLLDEPIVGTFYEQQLQKTSQTKFRIEKVLRKRPGQSLVKWKGYPTKFNSWVQTSDLEKL